MSSRSDIWCHRGIEGACIVLAAAFALGGSVYSGRDASDDDSEYPSPRVMEASSVRVIADVKDPDSANFKPVDDDWQKRQVANSAYISTLAWHNPIETVIRTLGMPDFVQTYNNGVGVLMYRTRNETSDFRTTKDETAALVFRHGELIGLRDSKDWFELDRIWAEENDNRAEPSDVRRKIGELSIGDHGSAIIAKLGQPDFLDYPADDLEILSYRTHSVALDGFTERNETTRLMLRDGVLLAVGK